MAPPPVFASRHRESLAHRRRCAGGAGRSSVPQIAAEFLPRGGVVLLLLILVDWLVGEQPLVHPENAVRIPAALLLFFLARSRARRLHATVLVTSYGLFGTFIAVVYVRA